MIARLESLEKQVRKLKETLKIMDEPGRSTISEYFITARVLSTREGNIYTWECLSVHHWWGGGGTPSQVWGVLCLRCW